MQDSHKRFIPIVAEYWGLERFLVLRDRQSKTLFNFPQKFIFILHTINNKLLDYFKSLMHKILI